MDLGSVKAAAGKSHQVPNIISDLGGKPKKISECEIFKNASNKI